MSNLKLIIFSILFIQFVSVSSIWAADPLRCDQVLSGGQNAETLTEAQIIVRELRARVDAGDSMTNRQIVTAFPSVTAELAAEAAKVGMMLWGARIYLANSVEAARLHSNKEADLMTKGLYLIVDETNFEELYNQPAAEVFLRYIDRGGLHFFDVEESVVSDTAPEVAAEPRQIYRHFSPEFLRGRIDTSKMLWKGLLEKSRGQFINFAAWARPLKRGVIMYEDTLGGSQSTWSRRRKELIKKMNDEGYTYSFAQNVGEFTEAMDAVLSTLRVVDRQIAKDENGSPILNEKGEPKEILIRDRDSRYADNGVPNAVYRSTVESFKGGKAYAAMIRDRNGKLLGGFVGSISGSLISVDTVFQDDESSIDIPKWALIPLMDRAVAAGIRFIDMGMVTPYTRSMKGKYLFLEEFEELVRQLPAVNNIDLVTPWTPPPPVAPPARNQRPQQQQ